MRALLKNGTSTPLGRAVLLFAYLFLIICSYVVGKAARDALFLDRFRAVQLPYADIAIAILVGVVVAGYVRVGRRMRLPKLLFGSLLVYAACCFGFWWLARTPEEYAWLYPTIYVWVGIFGVLATAQVWTLANYVLTTREAKRHFAMIAAGAISGWIAGGLLTTTLAGTFGTQSLLLAMGVILLLCVLLVQLLARHVHEEGVPQGEPKSKLAILNGLRQVASHPHLRMVAAVIWLSSFVTTIAGWQFKAIAKGAIPQTDALAAFFGNFNFYAGIISLAAQVLLTTRLLRRFGIGPALLILPVALLFSSSVVLVWGTLIAAVLLKGSDQILRYSIDKATVELLYLPVPSTLKVQTKSFIDTFIWRMGDGVAGVALLIATGTMRLNAQQVAWISLAFLGLWIGAVIRARRTYVETLRSGVRSFHLEAEPAGVMPAERSAVQVLSGDLGDAPAEEIVYRLKLLQGMGSPDPTPPLHKLLSHRSAAVRREAVVTLAHARDEGALHEVEKLLMDPEIAVRTEALVYLTLMTHTDPLARLTTFSDDDSLVVRTSLIAYLAKEGAQQNLDSADTLLQGLVTDSSPEVRRGAARLIGNVPGARFDRYLSHLLEDSDHEVVVDAICSVFKLRARRFVPFLIEKLEDDRLVREISIALSTFHESITGILRDHLLDRQLEASLRGRLPNILARIGTQSAVNVLEEALLAESDPAVRFAIISGLNKLQRDVEGLRFNHQLVEYALATEVADHYHSHRLFATMTDTVESGGDRLEELRRTMDLELERIFRLLDMRFPRRDLHSAHFGLVSAEPRVHDNALELLENILTLHMREVLMPLFDSRYTVEERLRAGTRYFGSAYSDRRQLTVCMLNSSNAWLKACGAYAVGAMGIRGLERELEVCCESADPQVRMAGEQARASLKEGPLAAASGPS